MRKGSYPWWIVVCVVLGVFETVLERVFEHLTGWEVPDLASGIFGAAVIGILVGLIGVPGEKPGRIYIRARNPGGKTEGPDGNPDVPEQ